MYGRVGRQCMAAAIVQYNPAAALLLLRLSIQDIHVYSLVSVGSPYISLVEDDWIIEHHTLTITYLFTYLTNSTIPSCLCTSLFTLVSPLADTSRV